MPPSLRLEELGRRLEAVGPDGEDHVLALVVLAQRRADAGEQHREPEGLGDVVVGARLEAEDLVGIAVVAGQHDDRALNPSRRRIFTASRPSMSGSPTSRIIRSTWPVARLLQRFGPGRRLVELELAVVV